VYIAPTNNEIQEEIYKYLKEQLEQPCRKQTKFIIMGDFNAELEERDTEEEREAQKQKKGKNKKKLILEILEEKNMLDIYKATNSKKRITTWNAYEKNTFARLRRKDRETLSIDSDKVTEKDWIAYKSAGETLPKKKRAPELQELQVEDENLRMLKKDIRRIAKWCSKIKKFKFQETEDSELDLFILEEGAKVLKKI
ncbi:10144_t:CDS:2, partial [Gigaspora rosea]